ncbi:alpha/beta fold hydrolase [Streptomyces sp. NRRL S-920]|uniref:alpha/beta fold hydrolase n=1 Tax=Streptomyces sp. NRRL S-920 TaxID=1463921 RepID=UPI0004C5C20F|nr:alpha/beta hydrolase [Streptomyces sp. NRRL S-920]
MSQSIDVHVTEHELHFRGFRYVARLATAGGCATEPVVVLGGSSQDRFSWLRYERVLLSHSSMLTLELPGYGDADPLPVEHGIDFLADTVRHAVDALSLGPVNVFGACFGAAIALRLAQRHPDRVTRLMLGGTAQEISPEYIASAHRWRRMVDDGLLDDVAQDMVEQFMSPPEHGFVRRRAAVARLMRQRFAHLTARELAMDVTHHERLLSHAWSLPEPVITAPALVFTGEHDSITPPPVGRRVAEGLGARFATIKDSDHLVQIERDTDLADLMDRFFTDQPLEALPYLNPVECFAPA